MKKYKVVISEKARDDIVSIYNYVALDCDNKVGAIKVIRKIETRYNKLSIFPEVASVMLRRHNEDLRFIRAGKYTIVYYISSADKTTVVVHRVMNSRRDIMAEIERED